MSQNQELNAFNNHLLGQDYIVYGEKLVHAVSEAYPELDSKVVLAYLENYGNVPKLAAALTHLVQGVVQGEDDFGTYPSDAAFYDYSDDLGDGIYTFGRIDVSEERYDIYTKISIPKAEDPGTLGLTLAKAVSFTTAQQVCSLELEHLREQGASAAEINETLVNRDKALEQIRGMSLDSLREQGGLA